jgi:hypothetical protein
LGQTLEQLAGHDVDQEAFEEFERQALAELRGI